MDKINIYNLEVFANHGVFPEETVLGQKFLVSATLYTDVSEAGRTDNLTKSVHYGEVCSFITKYMKEHTFKLIESVAEHLAREILLQYERLEKIKLEVKKPWAPVGLPIDTVSVEVTRQWHIAYIAIGSNMGDKQGYITDAINALKEDANCKVTAVSDMIVTEPYGGVEQDEFLNGCIELKTLYHPFQLLDRLHEIEQSAQRERTLRWGPRTLDLDIIFFDEEVIDSESLTIPHIDMQNRGFVLEPLNQIASYRRHPIFNRTVMQMYCDYKKRLME